MPIQLLGADGATVGVFDTLNKSQRVSIRPIEYGSLGIYSLAGITGIMAAGLAANAEVFQLRYTGSNVLLIREVMFCGMGSIAAFAAGVASFQLFKANAWSVDGSGGSTITVTGDNNKHKTSMTQALSAVITARVATTGAITAGTKTLILNPHGIVVGGFAAVAGAGLPPGALFSDVAGKYPLAVVNQEGIVIRAVVPATGTWTGGFSLVLEEVTAANWPG